MGQLYDHTHSLPRFLFFFSLPRFLFFKEKEKARETVCMIVQLAHGYK